MTLKEFAKKLDGRNYRNEIFSIEEIQAKKLGFVVVFGYSDDNMELRGAISEEISCYGGGDCYIETDGIFEECECECKYSIKAREGMHQIKAIWCDKESDYAWRYETLIPHETFEILDDGDRFCQGIVFDINNLVQRRNEA